MKTDVEISLPIFTFVFDGPVASGSVVMDEGVGLIEYGTGPAPVPNPDRAFGFRVVQTVTGSVWAPGEEMDVTVVSNDPVHLTNIEGASGNHNLLAKLQFPCDKS